MADGYLLAGEGALWIQPDGPNTKPVYLGCHTLGEVGIPYGDITLSYLPTEVPNEWVPDGAYRGAPGPVTTTITTRYRKQRDTLEKAGKRCPVPVYFFSVTCGKKNIFGNYDRGAILGQSYITTRTLSNLASMNPDDQNKAEQAFAISAVKSEDVFNLKALRVTPSPAAETESLFDIVACGQEVCAGDCGDSESYGDAMYAVGGVLAGSPINTADMMYTLDNGASWDFGSSDPFAAGEEIRSVQCVFVGRSETRIIVARGTTDAGNPMEIAYSDDNGLTWTNVDVGSVNGQYAVGSRALYAYDYYNIWLVTTEGYVYKSEDGGASWVAQSSGGVTTEDLYAVYFINETTGVAGGANNALLKTIDGGATWQALTGPAGKATDTIMCLKMLTKNRIWLGYNDGEIWYSHDGGTTWYEREGWTGSGTGSVQAMDWYDEFIGAFVHNDADGVGWVFYTVNGGYDWERISTPTNAGLNSIIFISPTELWAVGDTYGGLAMIVKVVAENG